MMAQHRGDRRGAGHETDRLRWRMMRLDEEDAIGGGPEAGATKKKRAEQTR
jgi:hypothetical protein